MYRTINHASPRYSVSVREFRGGEAEPYRDDTVPAGTLAEAERIAAVQVAALVSAGWTTYLQDQVGHLDVPGRRDEYTTRLFKPAAYAGDEDDYAEVAVIVQYATIEWHAGVAS